MFIVTAFILLGHLNISAGSPQPNIVMCKNKSFVRTIRVEKNQQNLCETTYTKAGVDKVIGSGLQTDSCVKILENVKTNLEGAGWKCKDISTAKIEKQ